VKAQTMTQEQEVATAVKKSCLAIFGWFGSITLGDVQLLVAIVSGLAVLVYTLMNGYVLWRDKLRRREDAS